MNSFSFKKVDKLTIKKIKNKYKYFLAPIKEDHVSDLIELKGCKIKIYNNNTVLFQGTKASNIASNFFTIQEKENIKSINFFENNIIGSDEVGTGDIFGPIIVTASLYNKKHKNLIQKLNIRDSKLLTDEYILKIGKVLIDNIHHKTTILDNKKYNEIYPKYQNINIIKTLMHNNVIGYMIQKYKYKKIFIDKFTTKNKYLEHLKKNNKQVNDWKNTIFEHKGESKHISVAISSIISRYYFLKEIDKLNSKYNLHILLGANKQVKQLALNYKKHLNKEIYLSIVKNNFNLL